MIEGRRGLVHRGEAERAQEERPGVVAIPGGHVEEGEGLVEEFRRELWEGSRLGFEGVFEVVLSSIQHRLTFTR